MMRLPPIEGASLLSRRRFIAVVGTSLLFIALPRISRSKPERAAEGTERRLSFYHIHTRESLDTAFWSGGGYRREGLDAIDRLLRDHRTGTVHAIDPPLLDLLFAVHKDVRATGPFHVICGYRTLESNAYLAARSKGIGAKSMHMEGKAIDVRLPGVPLERLRDAALALRAGGVGYYPRSDFIHVDTGRVRRW